MDRNDEWIKALPGYWVALRKESVDRNVLLRQQMIANDMSLSARRAWIEIKSGMTQNAIFATSLSARRAWIEIGCWLPDHSWWLVALRKESVDRNAKCRCWVLSDKCRSPQGERG